MSHSQARYEATHKVDRTADKRIETLREIAEIVLGRNTTASTSKGLTKTWCTDQATATCGAKKLLSATPLWDSYVEGMGDSPDFRPWCLDLGLT